MFLIRWGKEWLLSAVCATAVAGPLAAAPPGSLPPSQPPTVAPAAGTPAPRAPAAVTPAAAAPDEGFFEFLGSDDVGDAAWWEFLKKVPPSGSDTSARPPQDAKK